MNRKGGGRAKVTLVALSLLAAGWAFAQPDDWAYVDRSGTPLWEIDRENPHDVFTFVRVKYSSAGSRRRRRWGGGQWSTDFPDSDLNFSFRLQQVTSLKVNPQPKILELTDPALYDYPFIYIVEPGALEFSDEEVKELRRYLLGGGFLMVDDFWGEAEWQNFYVEMKRVFPEREPVELPISHPIFSAVFPLKAKPQIPNIHHWMATGLTYERDDAQKPDYRAFFDDKGRMMVMICHNTDLGDGWEREGEDEGYFKTFSEPQAYPLGINIIFYAMTH
jgi:hypothetical protein